MDKFTNSSEYDRQQAKEHARVIAFGVALAAFSFTGILIVTGSDGYSWLGFWLSCLVGLVAWGLTYAIVYVIALPTEPGDWNDTPEREVQDTPPPANDQTTKHQFTAVFDGRLRVGNSLYTIPADVGEDNIRHIAEMRRRGALETVSLRALDSVGISRHATNPPNAHTVLRFLSKVGAIDSSGEWTRDGLQQFPSPITNGRMGQNAVASAEYAAAAGSGGVTPPAVRGV